MDPESTWWNRDRTRRAGAYALWTLAILFTLIGTPVIILGDAAPLPAWAGIIAMVLPIPMLVAGAFLYSFGTDRPPGARLAGLPLALYFIAMGVGLVVGDVSSGALGLHRSPWMPGQGIVLIGLGIIAILLVEWLRVRSNRRSALEARVERSGVTTAGVVTRARGYTRNYRTVTRATVRFVDSGGRERWVTATLSGEVRAGAQIRVRYLPDELDRRGAVILGRR